MFQTAWGGVPLNKILHCDWLTITLGVCRLANDWYQDWHQMVKLRILNPWRQTPMQSKSHSSSLSLHTLFRQGCFEYGGLTKGTLKMVKFTVSCLMKIIKNPAVSHWDIQVVRHWDSQSVGHSVSGLGRQVSQSVSWSVHRSVNQYFIQLDRPSVTQSLGPSVNQAIKYSVQQLVCQPDSNRVSQEGSWSVR